MKMNLNLNLKMMVPVVALAVGILLPGCAMFEKKSTTPMEKMTSNERDNGAQKTAKQYMANFYAAFRDKDIKKFEQVISEDRRKKLTPEIFNKILEASLREQGKLIKMEEIGVLNQVIYQTYLWKLTYEKKDAEKKMVQRDFLYSVSIGKTGDDQYAIGAAGFRL